MEIAKLYGSLGFKFDPKGLENFSKSLNRAHSDMVRFANSIRHQVHAVNNELAAMRAKLNFSGGNITGTQKFTHLKDAITHTKIALDALNARSSVYGAAIERVNNKAAAGIPIWRAYKTEVTSVQHALRSLGATLQSVHSLSRVTINQRGGAGGLGGAGAGAVGANDRNGSMALLLGGMAGGGLFNTARTAIVAGLGNAAVFGTGALVKNVIDRGRELRASEQVLMANAKDHNEYQYTSQWIDKLSDRLGTNLIESQKAFGSILMSARAGGGNLEQSQKVFTSFAEYATTMHLSQETQTRLLRAVQQTYTIQKIHGQELNQFANAGLNMKALLVDAVKQAYGVDDKTARKMATSGKAETVKVMPFIAEAMAKLVRNNGALDRAIGSSQAEQGRFSNAFTKFSGNVMENGGDEALAKFFLILTKVVHLLNEFYDRVQGLNKLFNDMSSGHSAWVWALNLFIILLGRGAISFAIFGRAGARTLPMFWGVTRAVLRVHGVMGLLRAFIASPFMRTILAFAKRWLWIITVFEMVMVVGKAMNEHMLGYTTWFDLWIFKIKYLGIWFDLLALRAYVNMRRIAMYMKLSEPDINPDGTKNEANGFLDNIGQNAKLTWSLFQMPRWAMESKLRSWGLADSAPDPKTSKANEDEALKNMRESKAALDRTTGKTSVEITVHDPDKHVKSTTVNAHKSVGGN